MPEFELSLVRSFRVMIEANSPEEAARLAELYVGYADLSDTLAREKFQFRIQEIEMVQNDAIEVAWVDASISE